MSDKAVGAFIQKARCGVVWKVGGQSPLTIVAEKETMKPPPSECGSTLSSGAHTEHACASGISCSFLPRQCRRSRE